MANVKNFGLIGTGSTVQMGKAGPQLVATSGVFHFKNAAQTVDADIGTGNITASGSTSTTALTATTGNITATAGNLVLTAGNISLNQAGTISGGTSGVFSFNSTGAIVVPVGTSAQEPAAVTGGFRYNSTNGRMEYSNGTIWTTLATGGTAVTAVSVTTANGFSGTSSGGTTPALTLSTTASGLLIGSSGSLAPAVSGTDIKTVNGVSLIGSGDVGTINVAHGGTGATTLTGYVKGNGTSPFTASSTIPTTDLSGQINLTTQVSGVLPAANGGTGVANTNTITLGGNVSTGGALTTAGALTTSGAYAAQFDFTGATEVTFPTSGTLATVGNTVSSISGTANQITASAATGAVTLSIPTTFIAPGTIEATTSVKIDGNTSGAFLFSDAGKFVASTAAPLNGELLIGSTGASPVKGTITAGTGISVTNGAGSITVANTGVTSVTVASTSGAALVVSNPTVTTTGTISLAVGAELSGLQALSTTGFVVRTAAGTYTTDNITGTANRIVVANGSGITASPTIDLATVTNSGTGTLQNVTVDGYGRVTGSVATSQSDLTGVIGTYYLPETGGSMSGNISMTSGATVTGLPIPVASSDATNKAYVDAAVQGLTWKTAVAVATTAAGTLATSFAAGQVIDGYTLVTGNRILIKNQASGIENGIYVVTAGAPTRATDMATGANADSDAVFVQGGTVNANSGWVETAVPAIVGTNALVFTQFSGAGSYLAGTGLTLTGNTFSVNYGAGIGSLPTGEVGLELYSTGALTLTTDGSTSNPVAGSKLALITGAGLTQDSTGLYVPAAGITNSMLAHPSFVIDTDNSGTGTVALGSTLNLFGTTNRIVTNITGETVTFNIDPNYVGQSTITTLGTVTTGTWNGTAIAANHGGTGQTAYAVGDILYADTTNTLAKLSDVAAGSYLRSGGVSTAPVWSTTTLPNSATTGDLMYASGANTYANLADVATGNVLLSGGVGVAPSYGKVNLTTAVSGILPAANGGTGVANSNTITLGGNISTAGALTTSGAFATTFTMTGATNVTFPTSGTLATTGGTVASFSGGTTGLTPSSATTGAVTLAGTLATTNGGTGLTVFNANQLFYAGSTSTMSQSANLAFDGTSTLSVGGAGALTFNGATGTISTSVSNGNVIISGNGTGSVQIGATGAGLIQSDAGNSLTVTGSTGLILNSSSSAGTVMGLGAGATITVLTSDSDATGATYAAAIASAPTALVNKYYVDQAITNTATGAIKAMTATVPLNANGTTNVGTTLPAGAIILSVKVNVTVADTGAVLTVGKTGSVSAYADGTTNDPQTTGLYLAEDYVVEASAVQVIATVTGSAATSGSTCTVTVSYLY
jgi:hypothetical protein